MDWKKEAIEDLRNYEALKLSLHNIPEAMEALTEQYLSVKSGMSDAIPVNGGTSTAEDKMINNIAKRERLKHNHAAAAKLLDCIDKALQTLTDNERLVLEKFYINRPKRHIEHLCEVLGYEKTRVYEIADKALMRFTKAMYGVTQL